MNKLQCELNETNEKIRVQESRCNVWCQARHYNIISEEEAKSFLSNNTYYFKIKSYAKNYEKYIEGENAGKYINLEF